MLLSSLSHSVQTVDLYPSLSRTRPSQLVSGTNSMRCITRSFFSWLLFFSKQNSRRRFRFESVFVSVGIMRVLFIRMNSEWFHFMHKSIWPLDTSNKNRIGRMISFYNGKQRVCTRARCQPQSVTGKQPTRISEITSFCIHIQLKIRRETFKWCPRTIAEDNWFVCAPINHVGREPKKKYSFSTRWLAR